ncbi:MAG: Teichuronic acid biosynthesis protein TuaB [Planctomycetes bacterium ADurb.Bin412]|nr:MAG: Teichuronic acid biosynthesis protein TuaB [Planctomycetes bacterium ADurb.Bin412]
MVTMLSFGTNFVLRTGATMVLARLLTPKDYGLIAMVSTLTNFAIMLKDMGLSMATVQKAELNHGLVSTFFWINVAGGLALSLLLSLLAPALAWFYGEPRLLWIALAIAWVFLLSGLTVQHQALLNRQMRFGWLAVIDISSLLFGVTVAVLAAGYGANYWALVFMQLGSAFGTAVGVWLVCKWRPGWPRRDPAVRSGMHFGFHVIGFNIVNYFSRNFDNILIGRFIGAAVLGLYNRAYSLLLLPTDYIRVPLFMVAMPALSRIQTEPARYRAYCYQLTSLLALISMPLMIFVAVCSDSMTRLLLGEKWAGAAILIQIMALTSFIQTPASIRTLVQVSLGQTGRYFRFGLLHSIFCVLSFLVGLHWGAVGIAASYAMVNYLLLWPTLLYCFHQSPMSVGIFMKAISRPLIASLGMGAVVALLYGSLANQADGVRTGLCFAAGILVYFLFLILLPGGFNILREFYSSLSLLFQRSR